MLQSIFTIIEQQPLNDTIYKIILEGDTSSITSPGQFVNLLIDGCFLRRPISVCDKTGNNLTLIYRVVGKGTEILSKMVPGDSLNVLSGLGNGYDLSVCGESPVLLGGGAGIPPLYYLAKELLRMGKHVSVVLGFSTVTDMFFENEFRELGCDVAVTTVDGSYGIKGFATDAMPKYCSYFYVCGPEPMLKAVYHATSVSGQFSFEERMGCGFGACMGCSCKTITGYKRICKEGPVLKKEEILWKNQNV